MPAQNSIVWTCRWLFNLLIFWTTLHGRVEGSCVCLCVRMFLLVYLQEKVLKIELPGQRSVRFKFRVDTVKLLFKEGSTKQQWERARVSRSLTTTRWTIKLETPMNTHPTHSDLGSWGVALDLGSSRSSSANCSRETGAVTCLGYPVGPGYPCLWDPQDTECQLTPWFAEIGRFVAMTCQRGRKPVSLIPGWCSLWGKTAN